MDLREFGVILKDKLLEFLPVIIGVSVGILALIVLS